MSPVPVSLSDSHVAAVHRRRRIVVEYDAFDPAEAFAADFQDWLAFRFDYIDEPGSQVDSVWWDFAVDASGSPRADHPGLARWREQGLDPVERLVAESRRRGLEVFFSHRFSEVDFDPVGGLGMARKSPLKEAHPDWVVKTWWWQGLWNLASAGLRDYKLQVIRGIAGTYDLDGIQVNFARHMPCLPVGRQWELREHATEFIRAVRRMLLEIEAARGRPCLFAVKVPETVEGCRADGFDVAAWAAENLVDIFSLGSRTMDVDIAGFRRLTQGKPIKLCPCFDDHHATDGYLHQPIEFLRGVYGNWWRQGADAVETFNWSTARPEPAARVGVPAYYPSLPSHGQAYREIGSLDTLRGKDALYAVERRGVFPWSEGCFCRNDHAPLPATLPNDGRPVTVELPLYDDLAAESAAPGECSLRLVLYGAKDGDRLDVRLNGTPLALAAADPAWKDPQIFTPKPQPPAGACAWTGGPIDPDQKLALLRFAAPPAAFVAGRNRVEIRVLDRGPYLPGEDLQVEKVEAHVMH